VLLKILQFFSYLLMCSGFKCHWHVLLLQRQIAFNELTEVKPIAAGGFGVIHCARHPEWGTVAYKELKSPIIADGSKFVNHTLYFVVNDIIINTFIHK